MTLTALDSRAAVPMQPRLDLPAAFPSVPASVHRSCRNWSSCIHFASPTPTHSRNIKQTSTLKSTGHAMLPDNTAGRPLITLQTTHIPEADALHCLPVPASLTRLVTAVRHLLQRDRASCPCSSQYSARVVETSSSHPIATDHTQSHTATAHSMLCSSPRTAHALFGGPGGRSGHTLDSDSCSRARHRRNNPRPRLPEQP